MQELTYNVSIIGIVLRIQKPCGILKKRSIQVIEFLHKIDQNLSVYIAFIWETYVWQMYICS